MKMTTLLMAAALTGLLAVGCAQKQRVEGTEVPTQPMSTEPVVASAPPPPMPADNNPPEIAPEPKAEATAEPTAEPAPKPKRKNHGYIVVKGDTLWDIAAKKLAYGDSFQWPLIFKANRDQIKDPDLIYPKQEFNLRHDFSLEDVNKAKKDASDTPKFVPHTQPREALPIDYF